MVNRRDTLKLAAGAALASQFGTVLASEQETTPEGDLSGIFLAGATGGQQAPPVETEAQATASFAVNQGGGVDYALAAQDVENATMAHVHLGELGENGEVVVWLYPGPEAEEPELIEGEFSGMLATGTFEADDLTGPLEGESLDALLEAMAGGETYVNVHTEQNPGGEVRGQIVTVDEVVDSLGLEQQATETPEEETAPPEEETTTLEDEETPPDEEETPPPEDEEETTPPEGEDDEEDEETTTV